jgi:chemotaxis protein methyltransferase CheR
MIEQQTTKAPVLQNFLENSSFEKVKRMIEESTGLNCQGYRDEYLKRRFEVRLRATGTMTYAKYVLYLKKNPDEFEKLLNDLTINYTNFFRDIDVYEYLEKKLLPLLFKSKQPVKIWSAGCASGEEPYSLAILVHKILGKNLGTPSVSIIASDIDKDALGKASRGEYHLKQLSAMTPDMIEKFFDVQGDVYRIKDFVKSIIRFETFDLMKSSTHYGVDLILCRNVMIYFEKEAQQKIHMTFFGALKDGGYFITGKSEMLSGEPAKRFTAIDYITRVYQKPPRSSV